MSWYRYNVTAEDVNPLGGGGMGLELYIIVGESRFTYSKFNIPNFDWSIYIKKK